MNSPLPCNPCKAGPRDVEGHANLSLHIAPAEGGAPQRAAFKCVACGMEWVRTYMGSGVFAWNSVPVVR